MAGRKMYQNALFSRFKTFRILPKVISGICKKIHRGMFLLLQYRNLQSLVKVINLKYSRQNRKELSSRVVGNGKRIFRNLLNI